LPPPPIIFMWRPLCKEVVFLKKILRVVVDFEEL